MSRWKNFSMWRGRLPHWRADDTNYYVTFTPRRELNDKELGILYGQLVRLERKGFAFSFIGCRPTQAELIFRYQPNGEFSKTLEAAKTKANKLILKVTNERYPVLGLESYDRIIRDESEFLEFLEQGFHACDELSPDADYPWMWCVEGSEAFENTSSSEQESL